MELPIVIRGAFTGRDFVPDGPLPEVAGRAELIVYVPSPEDSTDQRPSILDVLGGAEQLRCAEELDTQLAEERSAWGNA